MSILDKNEKRGTSMGMYTALAGVLLMLIALFAPMSKEPRDTYTYTPPPPPASIIVDPIPAKNATSAPHSPEPALITPPQPIKQPEKSAPPPPLSPPPKQTLNTVATSAPQTKIILPVPPTPIPALFPAETINAETRRALVNIICTAKNSGVFMPVSGSGVIIDPRGVILTNAHLANIYLLKDYPSENFVECIVRSGSPARNTYYAELLYISSAWIKANTQSIIEENPTGTGENDFALLRITKAISEDEPLPAEFPYIHYELEENDVAEGQNVLIVGYPASFLGGITIQKDLHITSTISHITRLYTFDQNGLLDLIAVGTSILSQKGSSGGAVVRQQSNKLTGLIVTSSSGETTQERELNAITIAHINRSLKKEMNLDLAAFLNADIALASSDFQKIVAPGLTQILIDVVEKR
ncbi:MAG: hypothetical protein G01um101448_628 [Parcubacteria group bacterium Gr01-1014_48]|nr:MAG: hypothetical protein G01um101448_628 [Parcubacteria group bacterium Gr01-1014_48]